MFQNIFPRIISTNPTEIILCLRIFRKKFLNEYLFCEELFRFFFLEWFCNKFHEIFLKLFLREFLQKFHEVIKRFLCANSFVNCIRTFFENFFRDVPRSSYENSLRSSSRNPSEINWGISSRIPPVHLFAISAEKFKRCIQKLLYGFSLDSREKCVNHFFLKLLLVFLKKVLVIFIF